MNSKISALSLIVSAGVSLTAAAGGIGWTTDFAAATNAAANRSVPVFAYFSASDTSEDCLRFDLLVLKKTEFQNFINSNFVPFEADLTRNNSPKDRATPEKIKEQNSKLRKTYGVNSYPTVLVLNYKGQKIAAANYDGKSNVAKYIEELRKILKR